MPGLSFRTIAGYIGVAPSTVLYWVRNFALKVYEKPVPLPESVTVGLDEMRHFPGSKKPGLDMDMESILPRYRPAY
jgi:hypothetical protein